MLGRAQLDTTSDIMNLQLELESPLPLTSNLFGFAWLVWVLPSFFDPFAWVLTGHPLIVEDIATIL